ncbi:hypothetical protein ATERTT37_001624 [Aspergillus terreus]
MVLVPVEPGEPTPSASTTPIAASPSPSSGKIQKSSKKQIKVAPENLAKALDSIPEFEKHEQDNAPSFQHAPFSFQDVGLEKPKDEAAYCKTKRWQLLLKKAANSSSRASPIFLLQEIRSS